MTDKKRIEKYYDGFDEWGRLDTPAGRLEFLRTMRCLAQWLAPGSHILDLGGGPGRYAIALAQQGHDVDLIDLSPKLLQTARLKIKAAGVEPRVKSIRQASAVDLGEYESGVFDAIVALGPFYHLTTPGERSRAAAEIHRTLKPGGIAVISFIPRLCGVAGLIDRAASDGEQVTAEAFAQCVETGAFHNGADRGFQEGYYASVENMAELLTSAGFTIESIQSVRSLAFGKEERLQAIEATSRTLYEQLMLACDEMASDPAVVSLCGHAICIGRSA